MEPSCVSILNTHGIIELNTLYFWQNLILSSMIVYLCNYFSYHEIVGAACPHHSSIREVALLYLKEWQQHRANTNGYRSWSDVLSWQGMHWTRKHYCSVCSLQWDYSASILLHILSKPCLGTFNCTSSFTPKELNMHGHDTLPLHGKHRSAMNEQNRNCV